LPDPVRPPSVVTGRIEKGQTDGRRESVVLRNEANLCGGSPCVSGPTRADVCGGQDLQNRLDGHAGRPAPRLPRRPPEIDYGIVAETRKKVAPEGATFSSVSESVLCLFGLAAPDLDQPEASQSQAKQDQRSRLRCEDDS
jgi:hypothetical protein